jgi:hypothetical protein
VRAAQEAEAREGEAQQRLWYFVSDTHVRQVQVSEVLGCQAYLLMYVRKAGQGSGVGQQQAQAQS